MKSIYVVVKTVPCRRSLLRRTEEYLEKENIDQIVVDSHYRGISWSLVEGFKAFLNQNKKNWLLMLQDDFIYAENFLAVCETLVEKTSLDVIILFCMGMPSGKLLEKYGELEVLRAKKSNLCGVGLYRREPAEVALEVISRYCLGGDRRASDGVIMRGLHGKFKIGLAFPNPLQHIGRESVLGNSWEVFGRERKSPTFKDKINLGQRDES